MRLISHPALRLLWGCLIAAVVVLSVLPGKAVPSVPISDVQEHFTAYLSLAVIPAAIFRRARWAGLAVAATALLGVLLETIQLGVPGRAFEVHDIAANCAGTIAGTLAGLLVRWFVLPKSKNTGQL